MKVKVLLFARARDLAQTEAAYLDLAQGATLADLRKQLALDFPALGPLLEKSALAVDNEFAAEQTPLSPTSEVALLPPVSGG